MPYVLELTQHDSWCMVVPQQMLAERKEGVKGCINPAVGTKANGWVIGQERWQPGLAISNV